MGRPERRTGRGGQSRRPPPENRRAGPSGGVHRRFPLRRPAGHGHRRNDLVAERPRRFRRPARARMAALQHRPQHLDPGFRRGRPFDNGTPSPPSPPASTANEHCVPSTGNVSGPNSAPAWPGTSGGRNGGRATPRWSGGCARRSRGPSSTRANRRGGADRFRERPTSFPVPSTRPSWASPTYRHGDDGPGFHPWPLDARGALSAGVRQGRRGALGVGRALDPGRLRQRPSAAGRAGTRAVLVPGGPPFWRARLRARRRPGAWARPAQRHRHRRRPGDHGGGQPRRLRGRRPQRRIQHHPAGRTAAQSLHHPMPTFAPPLPRDAQRCTWRRGHRSGRLSGRALALSDELLEDPHLCARGPSKAPTSPCVGIDEAFGCARSTSTPWSKRAWSPRRDFEALRGLFGDAEDAWTRPSSPPVVAIGGPRPQAARRR